MSYRYTPEMAAKDKAKKINYDLKVLDFENEQLEKRIEATMAEIRAILDRRDAEMTVNINSQTGEFCDA